MTSRRLFLLLTHSLFQEQSLNGARSQSPRRLPELRLRTKLPHLRTTRRLLDPEPLVVAELYLREVVAEAELQIEEAVAHVADPLLFPLTALEPRTAQPCLFPQRSHLLGALRNLRRIPQRRTSPLLINLPHLRQQRHPSLLLLQ